MAWDWQIGDGFADLFRIGIRFLDWQWIDRLVIHWQIGPKLALHCWIGRLIQDWHWIDGLYWIGRLGKDWHWIGVIFLMNDGLVKDYQVGIGLGDYQRIGTVFLNSAMD